MGMGATLYLRFFIQEITTMITADKFNLFNATEDDVIRLNQALAYL